MTGKAAATTIMMEDIAENNFDKLWDAVKNKDLDLCKKLFQDFPELNTQINNRKKNQGILHLLANQSSQRDSTDILSLLLKNGASAKAWDKWKNTALHVAAHKELVSFCRTLINFAESQGKSLNVNLKNKDGMTPLHLASKQGYTSTVKLLLEHKADPKLQDNQKWLALHYAADGGFLDVCKTLFALYEGDTSLNNSVNSPLMLAAKKGWYATIREMDGEKVNLDRSNSKGKTALHFAASSNFTLTVSVLIELGCDVNAQDKSGNTPIMVAALGGHLDSVEALADGGARLDIENKEKRNVLHLASADPSGEVMSCLLDAARANDTLENIINHQEVKGYTPLHVATKESGDRNALLLLDAGADPNLKSWFKLRTPLHQAVKYEKVEVVKRLFEIKELQDEPKLKNDETPFHLSATLTSPEICRILLSKGPTKNAVTIDGETAIHLCAKHGHPSIMKTLLSAGVDQFAKDSRSADALHHAADRSDVECCRILMKANKKRCTILDDDGKYPLDVAYTRGRQEVFTFLLNSMPYRMSSRLPAKLQAAIRRIARDALEKQSRWAVAAIVESEFWQAGFGAAVLEETHPSNTTKAAIPCDNFRRLISMHPDLAKQVMDKCIRRDSQTETTVYDFRIFEDNYYVPNDHRDNPYDYKTWTLLPKAVDMYSDKLKWKKEHPLELMSRQSGLRLVQHELPMAWLNHKFMSYTWVPFSIVFFLQVFSALSLMGYMWSARTWEGIARKANVSVEEICSEVPDSLSDTKASIAFYTFTVILFTSDILLEGISKLRVRPTSFGATFWFLMFTCLMTALLVPTPHCNTLLVGVKWVYPWECGILCILIAWFRVVNTISKLPAVSLFTPVTQGFVFNFIKSVVYVITVIGVYAYIFCLLFPDHPAFQPFPQALIKSFTWMFGDLGYDDTFVELEVHYPVFANFLFLLFLYVIAGVIFTLVKSPAIDDDLVYYQRTVKFAEMILRFDVSFPCCRKPAPPRGKVVDNCFKYCYRRHVVGKKCTKNYLDMAKLQKRVWRFMLGSWLSENSPEDLPREQVTLEGVSQKVDAVLDLCRELAAKSKEHDELLSQLRARIKNGSPDASPK